MGEWKKMVLGSPNDTISASQQNGSDGLVWTAMDCRISPFGFLAEPSNHAYGTASIGLQDQRLAL
jgi:carboxylesterase type B